MQITEGAKIELSSVDVENIIEEWAIEKLKSIGCDLTRIKVESPYPGIIVHGVKQQ